MSQQSIGIFDSGLGGLTVMREVVRKLPFEHVIYFGDTARVPYGNKSPTTVKRYSLENAIFLMEHDIKILVVACNTASSFSVEKLKKIFNIPVVDVIAPSIEEVRKVTVKGRIGVLGTRATIQSGVYQRKIQEKIPDAQVTSVACPLLVPLVEEGLLEHAITQLMIREYLTPLLKASVDTIVLACTHYPLLKNLIGKECQGKVGKVVDSASCCAGQVQKVLFAEGLENRDCQQESHHFFVSDNPEGFQRHGEAYLGFPIETVTLGETL